MKFFAQSHFYLTDYLSVIRERVSIAVVYSSNPEESGNVIERTFNSRSWKAYKEVAEQIAGSLRTLGFRAVDTVGDGLELIQAIQSKKYGLYWLNTAGIQGRDPMSHAASHLESLGLPYIGHTPLQSALLDDKVIMKQWLRGVGLPSAPFIVRFRGGKTSVSKSDSDFAYEFGQDCKGPFVVKPAHGRGSVDIIVTEKVEDLEEAVLRISQRSEDRVIIESLLIGQEYCVWGSRGIIVRNNELIVKQGYLSFGHSERLFDLRKRIFIKEGGSNKIIDPCRSLTSSEQKLKDKLSYIARMIVSGLGLFCPIRIDLRLDTNGSISILEANPKPDLKRPNPNETGLLAMALEDLHCSFDDYVLKIMVDWLDYHLSHAPSSLAMLQPLFERYSSQSHQREKVPAVG